MHSGYTAWMALTRPFVITLQLHMYTYHIKSTEADVVLTLSSVSRAMCHAEQSIRRFVRCLRVLRIRTVSILGGGA